MLAHLKITLPPSLFFSLWNVSKNGIGSSAMYRKSRDWAEPNLRTRDHFFFFHCSTIIDTFRRITNKNIYIPSVYHWFIFFSSAGCCCTSTESVLEGIEGGPYKDSAWPMKAWTFSLTTEFKNSLATLVWEGLVKAKDTAKSVSQAFWFEEGLNFQTVFRCLNCLTSPQTAVTKGSP